MKKSKQKNVSKTDKKIARRTVEAVLNDLIFKVAYINDHLEDSIALLENTHSKEELDVYDDYKTAKAFRRKIKPLVKIANDTLDPIKNICPF